MPILPSVRFRVVTAAFLTQGIIIGSVFAYGIYFKILEEELGWSRTVLSASSSLAFLVMGMLAIIAGKLNDRYGPRWVLSATGLLTGIGYLLLSQLNQPWQLLLCYGLFIGVGLSTHDVVTLSTVAAWFDKRRGAMTGIVKTGTACGQMLMPLLVTLLVAAFGWRSSLWMLGLMAGLSLLLVAQWMRQPEVQHPTTISASSHRTGISYPDARKTRTLWTFCAIQFCFLPALMTIPLHIVVHGTDLGMSTGRAAILLSVIGGASIAGRLSLGLLFDRIGGKFSLMLCLAPLALSLALLLLVTNPVYLFPFALVYGIAHGGLFTVVSPTVAEYFGMRAHGTIFGVIVFFGTLGGASGPLLAGVLFDRFDSYQQVFLLLSGLAATGFVLAMSLGRPVVR